MKKALFNPLSDNFSYEWLDEENKPHTLSVPSREIAYFPHNQYDFMKRHLADAVLNERFEKGNYEEARNEVIKEIEVEI